MKYPYEGIGFKRFEENFVSILDDFFHRGSKQDQFHEDYQFVVANLDLVFIGFYPVINIKLRPAMVVDGKFSFEAINNLYNQLIANSNLLKGLSDVERTPLIVEPLAFRNQDLLNQIFDDITSNLSKKEGYIRCTLLGNRVNWSSRMVITPLPIGYSPNELVIPYNTALEFTKPLVLNKLCKLYNISMSAANDIFQKAHRKFNKVIYEMVKKIVTDDNFGVLINRNPTINLGSIIFLKVADVKTDIDDKTASLSNMILTPLNGDYDGQIYIIYMAVFKLL